MDTGFYLISAAIALALFILIARNLNRMDRLDQLRPPKARDDDELEDEGPSILEWLLNAVGRLFGNPNLGTRLLGPPAPRAQPPEDVTPQEPREEERPTEEVPSMAPPAPESPIVREIPSEVFETADEEAPPEPQPGADEPPPTELPRFSAYYPREVRPREWYPLLAYLFRSASAGLVEADVAQQLGERLSEFRTVGEEASQPIAEGALVTATPRVEGIQFNPPSISIGFFEDWHRFDFKLRADTAPLDLAANGLLTFTVEGVIVADIPLSIFVSENASQASSASSASATAKPYDAIFCSYSRKDLKIVERVERAFRALGMDYLRDMMSIRSGEEWNDALKTLIERADIFQLFWSSASSTSKHVAMEWEYALTLSKGKHFIRPVYWETPMPPVPDALGHIHFAYEPGLDD